MADLIAPRAVLAASDGSGRDHRSLQGGGTLPARSQDDFPRADDALLGQLGQQRQNTLSIIKQDSCTCDLTISSAENRVASA